MAQSFNNNNSKLLLGLRDNPPQPSAPVSPTTNEATEWVTHCKEILTDMESKNIQTRAEFWTQFVNNSTAKAMDKLESVLTKLNLDYEEMEKFQFSVDDPENEHLKFLSEWTGLKTQQMQYMPKSYAEFEYKAKNWLNGRKAPNYAQTLFPSMIHKAEEYAEDLSSQMFPTNAVAKNLLSTALRFGYLGKLCSAKISLNDTGRKTPLLIENSIKTAKSKTSKIFQQYAIDHPYSSQFPNHTSEAAQYFDAKHDDCLQRFMDHVQHDGAMHGNDHLPMDLNAAYNQHHNNMAADIKPILGIGIGMGNIPSIPFPSANNNNNIPPSLSDSSVTSNDNNNNNHHHHHGNNSSNSSSSSSSGSESQGHAVKLDLDNCNLPPPTSSLLCTPNSINGMNGSFAFNMPSSFRCTVSNLTNHDNIVNGLNGNVGGGLNSGGSGGAGVGGGDNNALNMISPGSTNTNSTFVTAQLPINSPSIATTTSNSNQNSNNNNAQFTLRSPNSGNVILTDSQYNQLMSQLDRLTSTQKEQKNTITQLVTRLHSLEQVIDNQRQVISHFPVSASNQSVGGHSSSEQQQHQFWNGAAGVMSGTPSCGYSLAQDFANAKGFASGNSISSSSHNGTPTLTTNSSSTNTPHSPHTPSALYNYFNPHNSNVAAAAAVAMDNNSNSNSHSHSNNYNHANNSANLKHMSHENDDDMEMSEHHHEDSAMNHLNALHAHTLATLPPFFDGGHDISAYAGNANLNGFSNFM